MRDTDSDWRKIGSDEPFWGVLTDPRYLRQSMQPDDLVNFYSTGVDDVRFIASELGAIAGAPLHAARALDFGCGVGRMSEAMARFADEVVAYDISPGMLQQAREHGAGRVSYVHELVDGPFDWINSRIVFQHIPPPRGLALLNQLLDRLAPGGLTSLHFNLYRAANLQAPAARAEPGVWRRFTRRASRGDKAERGDPVGIMQMYDYDFSQLCETFVAHGVERMTLVHGVTVFAQRKP